jgi:hypothetical protein
VLRAIDTHHVVTAAGSQRGKMEFFSGTGKKLARWPWAWCWRTARLPHHQAFGSLRRFAPRGRAPGVAVEHGDGWWLPSRFLAAA